MELFGIVAVWRSSWVSGRQDKAALGAMSSLTSQMSSPVLSVLDSKVKAARKNLGSGRKEVEWDVRNGGGRVEEVGRRNYGL